MKFRTARGKLSLGEFSSVRRRFVRYVRPHWRKLAVAGAAALGAAAMDVASPWPIKFIFDIILRPAMNHTAVGGWFAQHAPEPALALIIICGLIIVIAVIESVCDYVRDVLLAEVGQHIVGRIRHELFAHLEKLSPHVFETRRTGDLLTRLVGDIQMLRQVLVDGWIAATQNGLTFVTLVGFMLWLNPGLALISLATLPLIGAAASFFSRRIRQATEAQREKEGHVASIANEVIGAMMVVQAFNREKVELGRFARQNRSTVRAGLRTTKLEARFYRLIELSSAVALCVVLFMGVGSVIKGAMTAGDLLVFLAYMRSVNKPVRRLSKLVSQAAKATTCGRRIGEIMDIEPTIHDAPDAIDAKAITGRVELESVEFTYPDGTRALNGVSLTVEPGERIAIVGESGAGKSTLVKLLLRFYDPTAGAVRLDGTDIRRFKVASVRDQIAVVQQETVVFGLSVAENIALGCEQIDRDAVMAAAISAEAHGFIQDLPAGYDTVLSERGVTLSGGQRQRLALARALLRRGPVLLLDEPATGLDARTALAVGHSWMNGARQRTTVVICHQLKGMEMYDRVVLLHCGQIVDAGPHGELLERCPEYAELCHAWRASDRAASAKEESLAH